jgi:hypothetical protein
MQPNTEPQHERDPERHRDNPEPFAERQSEPSATEWRTVAQVASLLKITPRAIQRRCQAGKYITRRVDTPKGEAWEIDAASIETTANGTPNATATDHERQAEPFGDRTTNHSEPSANRSQSQADVIPAAVSQTPDQRAPDFAARYVAQIEKENAFLKLQIEEGNRNAAELRAALRKALEAQPRALTTGTTEANAAPEPRQDVPKIAPPTIAATPTAEAVKSPAIAPETAPTVGQARRAARQLFRALLGFK